MNIQIKNLTKTFGEQVIFEAFNMEIKENKITGILGPSGSGKTTLLNLCSGLIKPDSGKIEGINPRSISYIFQEPRLLPWRTLRENLRFVLEENVINKPGRFEKEIDDILKLVGLEGVDQLYPRELSGGMRQRVAIARAFLFPSELLLMDEPFSNLDTALKESIMNDFYTLWKKDKRTVIFVSHLEEEINQLSDEVFIFSDKPVKILEKIEIKH
ncbi:MAG: ABC transporter ATP-binding protein [Eubacteriaceae bacterium]